MKKSEKEIEHDILEDDMKKQHFSRKSSILLIALLLLAVGLLSGCKKKTTQSAIDFGNINANDIEKIELSGSSGGENGEYSHTLSESERKGFVDLLNRVELGDEVDEKQALYSGAVSHYAIYFKNRDPVTIDPGHYFRVDGKYYEFTNFDELWDEFVTFNSL